MDLGDGKTAHVQAVIGMQMAQADGVDVIEVRVPLQGPEGSVPKIKR